MQSEKGSCCLLANCVCVSVDAAVVSLVCVSSSEERRSEVFTPQLTQHAVDKLCALLLRTTSGVAPPTSPGV